MVVEAVTRLPPPPSRDHFNELKQNIKMSHAKRTLTKEKLILDKNLTFQREMQKEPDGNGLTDQGGKGFGRGRTGTCTVFSKGSGERWDASRLPERLPREPAQPLTVQLLPTVQ